MPGSGQAKKRQLRPSSTREARFVLDSQVGRVAGSYLARFAGSHGLELGDALIAAAATTSGVRLWTRNRKHYPMADVRFHDE